MRLRMRKFLRFIMVSALVLGKAPVNSLSRRWMPCFATCISNMTTSIGKDINSQKAHACLDTCSYSPAESSSLPMAMVLICSALGVQWLFFFCACGCVCVRACASRFSRDMTWPFISVNSQEINVTYQAIFACQGNAPLPAHTVVFGWLLWMFEALFCK